MAISQDRFESKDGRWYRVAKPDGSSVWLPSVSTLTSQISKEYLMLWYGRVGLEEATRVKNQTAAWGTQAHAYIERFIGGGRVEAPEWNTLPKEVQNCLRAYVRFTQVTKFKPLYAETTVYSLRYGYAGTLDCLGETEYKGKMVLTLGDWKTQGTLGAIDPSYDFQLAAYYVAYSEMHPESKIEIARCVKLCRDNGSFDQRILTRKQLREAFSVFMGLVRLWNYLAPEGGYKIGQEEAKLETVSAQS